MVPEFSDYLYLKRNSVFSTPENPSFISIYRSKHRITTGILSFGYRYPFNPAAHIKNKVEGTIQN